MLTPLHADLSLLPHIVNLFIVPLGILGIADDLHLEFIAQHSLSCWAAAVVDWCPYIYARSSADELWSTKCLASPHFSSI